MWGCQMGQADSKIERQNTIKPIERVDGLMFDSKFNYEDFTENKTDNRNYLNDVGLPEGFIV